jgi:hypothetical protein
VRKLISVKRLVEEAERDGEDPSLLFVDEDDVVAIDPDELDELAENPDEGEG